MIALNPALFNSLKDFCDHKGNRRDFILRYLRHTNIPFRPLLTEKEHAFLIRNPAASSASPQTFIKTLVAHYDRVEGSPGANDNSAAVLQLLSFAASLCARSGMPADLEILLSDGEELPRGAPLTDQGIYHLAPLLPHLKERLFLVFDMTGRGDAVVLGEAGENLLRRRGENPLSRTAALHRSFFRRHMEELLLRIHNGRYCHRETLFSDDLGLLMRGLPVIQISLMPFAEALALSTDGVPQKPPSWINNHTEDDTPESLEPASFALMEELLQKIRTFHFPLTLKNAAIPPLPAPDAVFPKSKLAGQLLKKKGETLTAAAPGKGTLQLLLTAEALTAAPLPENPDEPCFSAEEYLNIRRWLIDLGRQTGTAVLRLNPGASREGKKGTLGWWMKADAAGKPEKAVIWKSLFSS